VWTDLRSYSALLATALLLSIIVVATIVTALIFQPNVHTQTTAPTVTASVTSATNSSTSLLVTLHFPNGTRFTGGTLTAGTASSQTVNGSYYFPALLPGNYSIAFSATPPGYRVYLPSTSVRVQTGINHANLTIYSLVIFVLIETSALEYNNTSPGPTISAQNNTAVRLVIRNNTTLIHNVAIVETIANSSAANILFASLSNTLNAGGTTNDTFIVNRVGLFFYECLIGSHARDGEYGTFIVTRDEPAAS